MWDLRAKKGGFGIGFALLDIKQVLFLCSFHILDSFIQTLARPLNCSGEGV